VSVVLFNRIFTLELYTVLTMPKLNVIALGNELKMQRIAACVSHGDINILSVSQIPEAKTRLQNGIFDVILVDSLLDEAEAVCRSFYELSKIPVILLIAGSETNWPHFCAFKVDGFLSEDSSNIELIARIKASARRKIQIRIEPETNILPTLSN
jgi:DNA-binding response OmpR family regulator